MRSSCLLTPFRTTLFSLLGLVATVSAQPTEYSFEEADGIKFVVYRPDVSNEPEDARFPVVLYLHGSCSECVTHERILLESNLQVWHNYGANTQREPTFLIAPAGGTGGWTSEARRTAVLGFLDNLIASEPIDTQRVYIIGFSMGAIGTWDYIQYRPGFFAAANPQAIGGGAVNAALVKDTPIWATIGALDDTSRVEQLKQNVSNIRLANGDDRGPLEFPTGVNPRFTVFPATNHGGAQTATQQLPGFFDWFYAQVNDGNVPPVVFFPEHARYDVIERTEGTVSIPFVATDAEDGTPPSISAYLDAAELAGENIDLESGTVSFPYPGDGLHTVMVQVIDSGMKERFATIELSFGVALSEVSATATLSSLSESRTSFPIVLSRTIPDPDNDEGLTVTLQLGGTAVMGKDFYFSGVDGLDVTFAPGSSSTFINLRPVNDRFAEANETVVFGFAPSDRYLFDELSTLTFTITDDDVETTSIWSDVEPVEGSVWKVLPDGIGWIYDDAYPWVFSMAVQQKFGYGWIYVFPDGGTADRFMAYGYGDASWFLYQSELGAWIYRFAATPAETGWVLLAE